MRFVLAGLAWLFAAGVAGIAMHFTHWHVPWLWLVTFAWWLVLLILAARTKPAGNDPV